ncbi:class I SAM-dependent methyltransferase [candidate division KSB1 bacterium]|nr:MAG: class I SAM-dependent methyltransferase [candidate division KSB1 bacterium]
MNLFSQKAKDLFNKWAVDYHADGMEKGHINSVKQSFKYIPVSNGNYLEIGFGNGYSIEHIASNQYSNGKCFGLDISENMLEKASQRLGFFPNVHLETGNFITWHPPSGTRFSCIFSMEVFYYFKEIQAGIEKAASLLEPGGRLMVLVNYYAENEVSLSWPDDVDVYMTLWSEKDYKQGFEKAGLINIKQKRLNRQQDAGTLMTMGYKAV